MKQWSRWSLKGGVLQWDMFPDPTELLSIGLFDRINLDSKIQIKYIASKKQLADILTKGSFTRDEWNHLLSLFNISHFQFYSLLCYNGEANSIRIRRRTSSQQNQGPMMNLTARMPSVVSSSTSSSPGKTWYGYQDPGKSVVVDDRSGQPDRLSPAGYSKLDYGRSWSSQECKSEVYGERSIRETWWNAGGNKFVLNHEDALLDGTAQSVRFGELLRDRSGQLDNINSQEAANSQNFIMEKWCQQNFVNRVNDQVRKRQKRMSKVAGSREEHSIIWWMFMAATMNSATFMGKNFPRQSEFHNEHNRSHTEENVRHISKIGGRIRWDLQSGYDSLGKTLMELIICQLIGDETVINLQRAKVYVFSDSVLCLGKVHSHPKSNEAWKDRIEWIIIDKSYRDYDGINGEPTKFEWNIFPGFTTLQLCGKVTDLL